MHSFLKRALPLVLSALLAKAAIALPDDGFVDVTGGRVAFRVIGEGDKTPIIFIHGGPGGSSCSFMGNIDQISKERPVILYDQLGSGSSDRIVDLDKYAKIERFVSELDAIRDDLGLEEVHLLGHSWGAAVALEYLLLDPEGVKSVIFMGPYFGTERWIQDANYLLGLLPKETQNAVNEAKASGDFSTDSFKEANALFEQNYVVRNRRERNIECIISPKGNSQLYTHMWGPSEFVSTGTLLDYDRIDQLPQLKLPVLFLIGEYDEARPETIMEFQSLVPNSSVKVVANAGHALDNDQPIEFNNTVIEFLGRVENEP